MQHHTALVSASKLVFPKKTLIIVGATAFVALLPMHVALFAAVNNDGLAEMLVMASMLILLYWMRGRFYFGSESSDSVGNITVLSARERQQLLLLGLLLGLGMLTKIYAYILTPIALAVIVSILWLEPRFLVSEAGQFGPVQSTRSFWRGVKAALWAAAPAFALASILVVSQSFRLWRIGPARAQAAQYDRRGSGAHGRLDSGQWMARLHRAHVGLHVPEFLGSIRLDGRLHGPAHLHGVSALYQASSFWVCCGRSFA